MSLAVYDKIGKTYDQTRKADSEITAKIISFLSPKENGCYLDVGCGSGNYTEMLFLKEDLTSVELIFLKKCLKKRREKTHILDGS